MELSTPSRSLSNSPVIPPISRLANDSPLTPGPPDSETPSIPPAAPAASTVALEDSGTRGVLACVQAGKPDGMSYYQMWHVYLLHLIRA
jgi:hypothetical protein